MSVAMAAYNGEKYIGEQIDSILVQMGADDELIISVDPSSDRTKTIAQAYADKDSRIRVLDGPGCGVVRNFENALSHAARRLYIPYRSGRCVGEMASAKHAQPHSKAAHLR